jgi:hypothetical protein
VAVVIAPALGRFWFSLKEESDGVDYEFFDLDAVVEKGRCGSPDEVIDRFDALVRKFLN